jgi:hypothetical protein
MNQDEARVLLNQTLGWQRRRSYSDLRAAVGTVELTSLKGRSLHKYSIQICVLWDGEPDGDIRVMGTAEDGGGHPFAPVSASFVVAPDGTIAES